jgi:hypothetical protein
LIRDEGVRPETVVQDDMKADALTVLLQLQYKKPEAEEMIRKALARTPGLETSEELLNEVYKERKTVL